MKSWAALVFILSFNAFAIEGFYTEPSQNENWKSFTAAHFEKSVARLEDRSGGVCTGTFISNDGFMLTAAHCLEKCLEGIKGTKNIYLDPLFDISLYDTKILRGRSCPLRIRSLGLRKASIVYVGNGSANFEDEHIEKIPSNIQETLSGLLDFAIIKFESPVKTDCLKLSQNSVTPDEEIMSIGNPGSARRKSFSSDGNRKYFGFGEAKISLANNAVYNESQFSSEKIQLIEKTYNLDHYFVGSADMVPGFSGGPTLNLRGEILGVNTNLASFADYRKRYVADSAIILRSETIMKTLEEAIAQDELQKMFSCF